MKDYRQADIIKAALKANGMTPHQLSRRLGQASHSYVYRIIDGEARLTKPETIAKVAEILSINPDDLYLANDTVPPDVMELIFHHPQLLQVVRNLKDRLSPPSATA